MDASTLRKRFLWGFLVALAITAMVAIVAILGEGFGDLQWRIMATSGAVSAASICAMACAAFLERGRMPWFGHVGLGLTGLALALMLVVTWCDPRPSQPWGRLTALTTIWAVAAAHAQLLLLPRLGARHRMVQSAAVVAIAVLAALLSFIVFDVDLVRHMVQQVAVLAIVVALLTLAVPILWRIGGERDAAPPVLEQLTLQRTEDGHWIDAGGVRYEVRRLGSGM